MNGPRPCPFVDCRHHLPEAAESCALDVADRGPHTLEEIAALLGCTRERVRQIEAKALGRLRRGLARLARQHGGSTDDFLPSDPPSGEVLP